MNFFQRWLYSPAKWYQWWLPQSGILGGIVGGSVVCLPIVLHRMYG